MYLVLVQDVATGLVQTTRCEDNVEVARFLHNIDSKYKVSVIARFEETDNKSFLDFCKKDEKLESGGTTE